VPALQLASPLLVHHPAAEVADADGVAGVAPPGPVRDAEEVRPIVVPQVEHVHNERLRCKTMSERQRSITIVTMRKLYIMCTLGVFHGMWTSRGDQK